MVPEVEEVVLALPEELAERMVVHDAVVHSWQRMLHK